MAYVADYGRKWSPRRKAKAIDRSVNQALAEVAAHRSVRAAEWEASVFRAQSAVAALPATHFASLGQRFGIAPDEAEAQLMRLALSQPSLVLRAVENTRAKLAAV